MSGLMDLKKEIGQRGTRKNMNLKGLEEEKVAKIKEMESILKEVENEQRAFKDEELSNIKNLQRDVQLLNLDIARVKEEREKTIMIPVKRGFNCVSTMDEVVMPDQKFETRAYENKYDLGNFVKIMAGKNVGDFLEEQTYYRDMATANNQMVIPKPLSEQIIDIARANSAVMGQIPIIPMPYNNLTVATVKKDATASFVKENELIPSSDVVFESVMLNGKTLALFVPISEQLLDSTQNLSSVLVNTCASAIAVALDKALLYGRGVDVSGNYEEIKGITTYDTISKIDGTTLDYTSLIRGVKAVKGKNIEPTNIVMNTDLSCDMASIQDTMGQYINPPKMLEKYKIMESNNIDGKQILTYDVNSLLLGMHQDIKIEWGHVGDQFQRISKGLRIYVRADLALIKPTGIALTTIRTN